MRRIKETYDEEATIQDYEFSSLWRERKLRRGVRRRRLKNVQQLTLRKQRESVKNKLATLNKVTNC